MLSADVLGLIVLGICVVLFLTKWLPASVTGVSGCMAMVLLNVCTFGEAFSGFSSSIVLLMASSMIVGIAMFKTGVAQIIGRTAMRLSGGRELHFLLAMSGIGALLAMFFANTAIIAVFIPIIESVVSESNGRMNRYHLVLPMAIAVMLGGSATLVGCTPQLTANGLMLKLVGEEMTMWSLTLPALGVYALYMAYMILFGYRQGNRVFDGRRESSMEISPEKMQAVRGEASSPKKVAVMSVILAFMLASYVAGWIPVAHTAIISAILCVATGCCSAGDVAKELNWETVVFLASCLGLAEALTVAGSGNLVAGAVTSLLGNVSSPFALFALIVLFTLVLSQFITNSTVIIISLPIALALCSACGLNYMPFCVGVTLAASVACCTPLAAAQITMTQVAGYTFTDYVRYCARPSLVMLAGILVFVPLCYPLVG